MGSSAVSTDYINEVPEDGHSEIDPLAQHWGNICPSITCCAVDLNAEILGDMIKHITSNVEEILNNSTAIVYLIEVVTETNSFH